MLATPYISDSPYELSVRIGDTFTLSLTWQNTSGTPINLTGYTAEFQIVRDGLAIVSASSTGISPKITLGGVAGTIYISIPASTMDNLIAGGGTYALRVTSGAGVVSTLLYGSATLLEELIK